MIIDVALGILLAVAILIALWFVIVKVLQWHDILKGIRAVSKSQQALEADMKAEGVTYDDLDKMGRWNNAMGRWNRGEGPKPPESWRDYD
jgi:YD repeat-containing protein